MNLRIRILLTVGLTLIALVVGVTAFTSRLMRGEFQKLERLRTLENLDRAERAVAQRIDDLYTKCADWSNWDDTYAFMANRNPEFVRSNLADGTLGSLNIDGIVFADRHGRPFRSLVANRPKGKILDAEEILARLRLDRRRTSADKIPQGFAGSIVQREGILMVGVRPVLTTAEKGPSRGWVVFVRLLDGRELQKIRELTRLDLSVWRLDDASLQTSPVLAKAARQSLDRPTIDYLSDERLVGYTTLRDLSGRPEALLAMRRPRDIYSQGLTSLRRVQQAIVAVGFLFGAVILAVIEFSALRRLARLSHDVASVGKGGRVRLAGNDEIGRLAAKINEMLAELREGEARLHRYNLDLERTVAERTREMEHQAFHDALTELPNRAFFSSSVELALEKARQTELGVGLFFIDLDNFKLINDSLGHSAGDALLVEIAHRLRKSVRPGDTVARLGGDEFTVLLQDLSHIEEAEAVAARILQNLRQVLIVEGHEILPNGSIGIVYDTGGLSDPEQLMKRADAAMYEAKASGKAAYAIYDARMEDESVERLELEAGLRRAIEDGEIEVYFQPLIDLASGRLTGAEALARWSHPTRGVVSPGRFIPIAEETGLIVPLGYWVLEEACRQAAAWPDEFSISVNFSGKQLQREDAIERVEAVIERTGIAPHRLKLEITESVLMKDQEAIVAKMNRLKELGLRLALDDFGTGYSSLSTLKTFPVDTLKIDQAFVKRLGEEAEAALVIEAIMSLARTMKMDVTGEGVETYDQLRTMQDLGCQTGQGYLFDRPLSRAMFLDRLREEEALYAVA